MNGLILVDLQYDFMPGGNLAVAEGDHTVSVANSVAEKFSKVFATLDYHPQNHCSFASNHPGRKIGDLVSLKGTDQILWPDHCVQGTRGARLHDGLEKNKIVFEIQKGTNPNMDSYSGFLENDRQTKTELDGLLKEQGVSRIFVMGLATDYCVKFTVMDGLALGYDVYLIEDGCRAVNIRPQDGKEAITAMHSKGAVITHSEKLGEILGNAK